MQLEIKTEGVDFVVSRPPAPKNDNDGRQKADRETGAPLHVTELVAMDNTGAEVIKVTTAGEPKVTKRQLVTVLKLVATPWNIDGRGGWHSGPARSSPRRPLRQGPAFPRRQVPHERSDHGRACRVRAVARGIRRLRGRSR
jgi:hypothetical protein